MTNNNNLHYVPAVCYGLATGNKKTNYNNISHQSDFPSPPVAFKKAQTFSAFNHSRVDNYYWLKERANPLTLSYLKAENKYTDDAMQSTVELQEKLYNEMKARIHEDDSTVPVFSNGYYYYTRTESGKQYKFYCRKKETLEASEEILFDVNKMSSAKPAFIFAHYEISSNSQYAAYTSNETGSYSDFVLKVRDLSTGLDVAGFEITKVQDFVWANDNRTLFYTANNEALRAWKVYRHDLFAGKPSESVFQENDELFIINLQKSKTGDYLFISSSSFTTTEYLMLKASDPFGNFKVFMPRVQDVDYGVYHHKNKFFVQYKDKHCINGKLYEAPLVGFENRENWIEVLSHDDLAKIDYLDIFNDFYAIQIRRNGLIEIIVRGINIAYEKTINFPEPVYSVDLIDLPDYNSANLRYSYNSLNRPCTIYNYYPQSETTEVAKITVVPGGFDPEKYTVERIYATANDGAQVPIALLYMKGLERNGNNPTLIYSYGSYGVSTNARFMSTFYSLVDRGFVLALAQVRGGSDMGEQWYEDGKLLKKKNTFTDFIACSEKLISEKYTNPSCLSIMGGSAGGLLVAAVANMRPDLYKSVVAIVPFVDVMNTMLDPTLPLTTQEYEEWGDPNIKEYYDYMLSYSPYDNVRAENYPNMLVTAGLNDSQVGYHEPAKYVAKLREFKTDDNLLLLKTNMQSGHGGATGRFDHLRETAVELAFILNRVGINN